MVCFTQDPPQGVFVYSRFGRDGRIVRAFAFFEVGIGGDSLKVGFPMLGKSGEFMGDNGRREFPCPKSESKSWEYFRLGISHA